MLRTENVQQGSELWKIIRKMSFITASQVADLFPPHGYGSVAKFLRMKRGLEQEKPVNEYAQAMFDHGHKFEPIAREMLSQMYYRKIDQIGIAKHPEYGWNISGSPDGIMDGNTLIEIKCPFNCEDDDGNLYPYETPKPGHIIQVQVLMEILNLERCFYFCYAVSSYDDKVVKFALFDIPRCGKIWKVLFSEICRVNTYLKNDKKKKPYRGATKSRKVELDNLLKNLKINKIF